MYISKWRKSFANCATQRDAGFIVTMVTREILANSIQSAGGQKSFLTQAIIYLSTLGSFVRSLMLTMDR